jgi:hypothetical protein
MVPNVGAEEDTMASKTKSKKDVEFEVVLKFKPMKGLGGGFRQEWVSGSGNGVKFHLDTGTGLGNPMMTLVVTKGGEDHYFDADIRPTLTDAINKAIEAI